MATVRQSGGDYGSLNAAFAAAETTIDIDQSWTVADTTAASCSTDNVTVTVSGGAAHSGYIDETENHYRLKVGSGHCLTNTSTGLLLRGIVIILNNTGTSNECIRNQDEGNVLTVENSILHLPNGSSQQDGIYNGNENCTINLTQTIISGAGRANVHLQPFTDSSAVQTLNLNSCVIAKGARTTLGGGILVFNGTGRSYTINCHNTICVENTTVINSEDFFLNAPAGVVTFNCTLSIDSDDSIASYIDSGSGNLASRTLTDSDSPGAGNWVIVEDETTAPWDLRLKDNAENDAQDAHATATAHGLTIPSTDIVGTNRPQNTNYDIGPYEIAVATDGTVSPVSSGNTIAFGAIAFIALGEDED